MDKLNTEKDESMEDENKLCEEYKNGEDELRVIVNKVMEAKSFEEFQQCFKG